VLVGHYAPALLLHRRSKSPPLWALFLAAQAVDFLWDALVLTGAEHVRVIPGFNASNDLDLYDMPYSHSAVATVVWAVFFGAVWAAARPRDVRWVEGLTFAACVASHFVLDWVVHVPDLPLFAAQGTKIGLGLWRHRPLAIAAEVGVVVLCGVAWIRRLPTTRRIATVAFMALVAFVTFFVPTPPSPTAMALSALATYVGFTLFAVRATSPDPQSTGALPP
jgi:hypothetical protein